LAALSNRVYGFRNVTFSLPAALVCRTAMIHQAAVAHLRLAKRMFVIVAARPVLTGRGYRHPAHGCPTRSVGQPRLAVVVTFRVPIRRAQGHHGRMLPIRQHVAK